MIISRHVHMLGKSACTPPPAQLQGSACLCAASCPRPLLRAPSHAGKTSCCVLLMPGLLFLIYHGALLARNRRMHYTTVVWHSVAALQAFTRENCLFVLGALVSPVSVEYY